MSNVAEIVDVERLSRSVEHSMPDTAAVLRQIAHQLRQPLSAIEAIAYYLSLTLPPGETRALEQLEILQRLVQDTDVILSDAVHFLGASPSHPMLADLKDLVADAISQLQPFESQPPRVEYGVGPAPVLVDSAQATHAVRNLVSYLRQLAPDGEDVELAVSATEFEAKLAIQVATSVCTVAEVKLLLDPQHPHLGSGSGLAMASVRRIIDAHGGRIAVENQPPGGIRLTVIFPVAR